MEWTNFRTVRTRITYEKSQNKPFQHYIGLLLDPAQICHGALYAVIDPTNVLLARRRMARTFFIQERYILTSQICFCCMQVCTYVAKKTIKDNTIVVHTIYIFFLLNSFPYHSPTRGPVPFALRFKPAQVSNEKLGL